MGNYTSDHQTDLIARFYEFVDIHSPYDEFSESERGVGNNGINPVVWLESERSGGNNGINPVVWLESERSGGNNGKNPVVWLESERSGGNNGINPVVWPESMRTFALRTNLRGFQYINRASSKPECSPDGVIFF
ncbi:hypothetical protein R70723_07910 [Paenibacillus sp. FSL R7-0273]|uniref:hypothetical protein n=1 Tax=Paenibacillus sp. FSL R7-0273 TaxID=1536772 RepID=UPI0004F81A4F|nr:hypothetical protein [Paenibacillus sp. FSL R7-0273]AIQ45810.1 hypothetical protein R70723_07910 [Paenibacillus sp. FSL R7-0273]